MSKYTPNQRLNQLQAKVSRKPKIENTQYYMTKAIMVTTSTKVSPNESVCWFYTKSHSALLAARGGREMRLPRSVPVNIKKEQQSITNIKGSRIYTYIYNIMIPWA